MTAPPLTPARVLGNFDVFSPTFLKVYDIDHYLVPLHLNKAQRIILGELKQYNLILKGRQLGSSTVMQAVFYWLAVTRSISTLTLGHDQTSTDKMRRIAKTFQDNMPPGLAPTRRKDSAEITIYSETGSEAVIATAGNATSGRSMTFQDIHASEAAYYKDAEGILSGAMQSGNPRFTGESTANGAQGWFYEQCMEALDGNKDLNLIFLAWWLGEEYWLPLLHPEELGALEEDEERLIENHGLTLEQIKWRRFKKRQLKDKFPQEYPESPREAFLLSGRGYFGALDGVFTAPHGATPQEGHRYYGGIDWGMNDYTVLSIGDGTKKKQVALYRWNKMDWPDMRRGIEIACREWGVNLIAAEKNSMGSTNISELRRDGIQNIYNFHTNVNSKPRALGGLHIALNEDGWKLLKAETDDTRDQQREHRAYQTKQTANGNWTYSAPSGQHDDTVIANMLMINASIRGSITAPGTAG